MMNDFLNVLSTIKAVETPPFLFTRIQQRIENINQNNVSKKIGYSLITSFCVLLLFNIFVINEYTFSTAKEKKLTQTFGLNLTNNLY